MKLRHLAISFFAFSGFSNSTYAQNLENNSSIQLINDILNSENVVYVKTDNL